MSTTRAKQLRTLALVVAALVLVGATSTSAASKIGGNQIKKNAIASKQIKNNSVQGKDIKDGNVGSADVQDGGVGSADIQDGGVGSADIQDGGVGTGDLANGSVTANKPPPVRLPSRARSGTWYLTGDGVSPHRPRPRSTPWCSTASRSTSSPVPCS